MTLTALRSVLVFLLVIGSVSAGGPGGTYAFFNDSHNASGAVIADTNFNGNNNNNGGGGNQCGGSTKVNVSLSGPTSVSEDQTATYTGDSCHKNGDELTYNWTILTGDQYGSLNVTGTNLPEAEFYPEDVNQDRDVTIKLEACETGNGNNKCASDQVPTTIVDAD